MRNRFDTSSAMARSYHAPMNDLLHWFRSSARAARVGWAALLALPMLALQPCWAQTPAAGARPDAASRPADKADLLASILADIQRTPIKDQPFIERRLSPLYNRPSESRGVLNYRPPATLEKLTRTPVAEKLVIDAESISLSDGQGKGKTIRLDDEPMLQAYATSLRALVAGDVKPLRRYFDVQTQGTQQRWQVTLKPTEPSLRKLIREIHVQGKAGMIQQIETVEAQGDTVELTLLPRP